MDAQAGYLYTVGQGGLIAVFHFYFSPPRRRPRRVSLSLKPDPESDGIPPLSIRGLGPLTQRRIAISRLGERHWNTRGHRGDQITFREQSLQ
jgi:hypothetical protein